MFAFFEVLCNYSYHILLRNLELILVTVGYSELRKILDKAVNRNVIRTSIRTPTLLQPCGLF